MIRRTVISGVTSSCNSTIAPAWWSSAESASARFPINQTKNPLTLMLAIVASLSLVIVQAAAPLRYKANLASLAKRPTPEWYLNAKFGIFIHRGIDSVPGWDVPRNTPSGIGITSTTRRPTIRGANSGSRAEGPCSGAEPSRRRGGLAKACSQRDLKFGSTTRSTSGPTRSGSRTGNATLPST